MFNSLLKSVPRNSSIFSILFLFSEFIKIKDEFSKDRLRQISYFFFKVFPSSESMNFFLIDLIIDWFLETCQVEAAFLELLLTDMRDLLDTVEQFNHRLRSVDSIKREGLFFSVESLGFLGILGNSQKNEKINQILLRKSKRRKDMLNQLLKREPINIVFPNFGGSANGSLPQAGNVVLFREENFYSVDCRVERVLGYLIVIKFISLKNGKPKEKLCVIPFDHPCLKYASG